MQSKKYYIAITGSERRMIINALNTLRNKLLADGRYTDAIDDVLMSADGGFSLDKEYCHTEVLYDTAESFEGTQSCTECQSAGNGTLVRRIKADNQPD